MLYLFILLSWRHIACSLSNAFLRISVRWFLPLSLFMLNLLSFGFDPPKWSWILFAGHLLGKKNSISGQQDIWLGVLILRCVFKSHGYLGGADLMLVTSIFLLWNNWTRVDTKSFFNISLNSLANLCVSELQFRKRLLIASTASLAMVWKIAYVLWLEFWPLIYI